MKKVFLIICLGGLLLGQVACNNSENQKTSEKELELQKRELELKQKELSQQVGNTNTSQRGQQNNNTAFFIINVAAVKTESEAKAKTTELKNNGNAAGYLWIPDYTSLSGAEFYSVYIGPFSTQYDCEVATEEYRKKHSDAYGLLVSQDRKRIRINGIGNVTVTDVKPKCTTEDFSGGDNYGAIETISLFGDFKTILTIHSCSANGDYQGFFFEMFKKQNEKYTQVENKSMFKENQKELLKKINNLFKEKYAKLSKDTYWSKCSPLILPFINLNDLGMKLCAEKITFYASFEMNEECQCSGLEPLMIEMTFAEVEPYLIK